MHMRLCIVFPPDLQIALQKEQLVPFYVKRALANYPDSTPLPSLMMGMDALARSLPSGSPGILFCFERIQERAAELESGQISQSLPGSDAKQGLLHLLIHLVLVMDIQVSKISKQCG